MKAGAALDAASPPPFPDRGGCSSPDKSEGTSSRRASEGEKGEDEGVGEKGEEGETEREGRGGGWREEERVGRGGVRRRGIGGTAAMARPRRR